MSFPEKYDTRNGAKQLTMPQFYSFYREADMDSFPGTGGNHMRSFYHEELPKYVSSQYTIYVLRHKEAYWRTFLQSELNGEKYYYQQIVIKKAIYKTTFEKEKGPYRTGRGKLCL